MNDVVLINKNKTRSLFFEIKKPAAAPGEKDEDPADDKKPVIVQINFKTIKYQQ